MTQRERVYSMLRLAGSKGVRSDEFIKNFMPRGAARVQEIKDSGIEITSEREGKYTRYTLVGHKAEGRGQAGGADAPLKGQPANATPCLVSSEARPSMFDWDADWERVA